MSTGELKEVYVGFPQELRKGVQAGIPVALGYLPIAFAFGILAKSAETPFGVAALMSALVYAGASQFVAVQMLMTGTSLLKIVFLTFILNLRHFLMTATLSTKIEEKSSSKLALIAFGVTDETFSVVSLSKERLTFPYLIGVNFTAYSAWLIGTLIGFLAGGGLPQDLQDSMGIALYAMFIGLLIPSIRTSRTILVVVAITAIINSLLMNFMQTGTSIILSTILTAGIAAFVFPNEEGGS